MKGELLKDIIIRDQQEKGWLRFRNPVELIVARESTSVWRQLQAVELAVEEGFYAAGYITYEAASAFDSALRTKSTETQSNSKLPKLCFGIYSNVEKLDSLPVTDTLGKYSLGTWKIETTQADYESKIVEIKSMIDSGTAYQVNFTIRQSASFQGNALSFFADHIGSAPYAAYIDGEDYSICSVSPELFFDLNNGLVTTRPMKGTAPRGLGSSADQLQPVLLQGSEKDRAENIMIVDMIRNDLSKIAKSGSVKVSDQFKVEKHDSVWQMTTTVSARSDHAISDIIAALFPCASITGAPKVKAMEIIESTESTSRGIYTGTIGFIKPNGDAQFNVSIRTAFIDKTEGKIHYGAGGGIVADSEPDKEFEECLLKTKVFVAPRQPVFSILESLLWTPEEGFFLLEEHLERMGNTADYFTYPFDKVKLISALEALVVVDRKVKVRVLLDKKGCFKIEVQDLDMTASMSIADPKTIPLALHPIKSNNHFLYHKTTHRVVYEQALLDPALLDPALLDQRRLKDVLLWNERNELTESTIANIVIRKNDRFITPPVECGLLAGTFRQYLLENKEIEEEVVMVQDLNEHTEIYLINSVRKWRPVKLMIT